MKKKSLQLDHLTLGVCYYPEHWDKALWADDLRRMKEYGIEVIRIAEFAWNFFEPQEGVFTFDFFDAFMDLAKAQGMKVIFCTPSATPPAWMSEKYPEILNADIDGNLIYHGLRRHCNLNSKKYRFFVERIMRKLAKHYSKYENIVAWQLDNEINCECDLYHSESDHKAFRKFLKKRFSTLDELNASIGSAFWNQTYTSWDEVYLPRRTNAGTYGNPHLGLLEKRFISDTVISFFKLQADVIREYSKAPITTNGLFAHIDYEKLVGEVLDFITYDNYPEFAYDLDNDRKHDNGLRDRNSSRSLARTRGISPIFGIMEQQSGPSGWNFRMRQPAPKPGQARLWTFQAIAHGADYVGYFRWRTATFGNEIYWHGLNDYCNRPNRRTRELEETYSDVQKIQSVCGKEYVARVGILKDYDNEWDAEADRWHGDCDAVSYEGWFLACQKGHVPYDMIYLHDETTKKDLKKYDLLVYPHPTILTKERAKVLKAYVEAGGTLILGCRTGYKDLRGICYQTPMPGYAADIVGAEVEEFTYLSPYDEMQTVTIAGRKVEAPVFNDVLSPTDGEAVAIFEKNYYAGKPALVKKDLGKGRAYYFGAAFGEDAARALLALSGLTAPEVVKDLDIPEEVELAIRGDVIFLLNYGEKPVTIKCSEKYQDLIRGCIYEGDFEIPAIDLAVLRA